MIKFTLKQRLEIVEEYLSGVKGRDIEAKWGCSRAYPAVLCQAMGVKRQHKSRRPTQTTPAEWGLTEQEEMVYLRIAAGPTRPDDLRVGVGHTPKAVSTVLCRVRKKLKPFSIEIEKLGMRKRGVVYTLKRDTERVAA